jgi:hypothetical protein
MLHELFEVAIMTRIFSEIIVYVNMLHELFEVAMLKILSEAIVYVNVTRVVRSRHYDENMN